MNVAKIDEVPFNESEWTTWRGSSPAQHGGSDCGLFVAMVADFLTDDLPFAFGQFDMDFFRKKIAADLLRQRLHY